MLQSRLTKRGQTTLPVRVRRMLRAKAGDRLVYEIGANCAVIRIQSNAAALHGALASDKGRGMSFAAIRRAAAERVRATPTATRWRQVKRP